MSRYQYKPLGHSQFRILKLLPGKFDDPLWGRLEHCEFDPPHTLPTYEAISYAWGNQDDPETLTLVGSSLLAQANLGLRSRSWRRTRGTTRKHLLHIGQNLAAALRDLRSTSEFRIIWCDAVCINQHDLAERAAQVQRMADIYRHADRVVVWLAPDNEQVARALHILDEFGSHVGYDVDRATCYIHEGMDKTYLKPDFLVPLGRFDWQCVNDLLSLPWFTRLWVRQEITLANDSALLTSGRQQLLWSRFCSAVAYLKLKLEWDATVVKTTQQPGMTATFLNTMNLIYCKGWARKSLDNLVLSAVDNCQCADPRDKIYGVLGLQTGFDIPIDYTKTAKEVYTDWALGYYRRHSRLDFLLRCEMADTPSWVPDLSKPMSLELRHVIARSGLKTKVVLDFLPNQTVKMMATHCGTITELTTSMPNKPDPEVIRERFKSWTCQLFPQGIQSHDIPKIDELATSVSGGRAVENYDNGRFSTMDVKELLRDREQSFPSSSKRGPIGPKLFTQISNLLPSAAVLATKDGHFGLGTGAANIGDEIFVVLGCQYPIIMRSVGDSKYRVIAACYFPHLSHGEAILGHLPDGWKGMFDKYADLYFIAPDGRRTLEDPRLEGELPPNWEQKESRDRRRLLWKQTGDETWREFDPRQTLEKLAARGVKLEMITVV